MTDEKTEQQELERQAEAAADAIRAAAPRLLKEGEVDPRLVVLVARVAGELGASVALASDGELEAVPGELAEVVREAGREHHEMLRAAALPVAGSA